MGQDRKEVLPCCFGARGSFLVTVRLEWLCAPLLTAGHVVVYANIKWIWSKDPQGHAV